MQTYATENEAQQAIAGCVINHVNQVLSAYGNSFDQTLSFVTNAKSLFLGESSLCSRMENFSLKANGFPGNYIASVQFRRKKKRGTLLFFANLHLQHVHMPLLHCIGRQKTQPSFFISNVAKHVGYFVDIQSASFNNKKREKSGTLNLAKRLPVYMALSFIFLYAFLLYFSQLV